MTSTRAARAPAGVTTRLVGLVMIPVTVMCLLASGEVASRRSTAAAATAIDHGVVQLGALVELHSALEAQWSLQLFDVRFEELGVTTQVASDFVGIDLQSEVTRTRERTDRALHELGPSSPADANELLKLYADIDMHRALAIDVVQRLHRMESSTEAAIESAFVQLDDQAHGTNGGSLVPALESLQVADSFVEVASPQGIDLSAVWFPSPLATPSAQLATLARLSGETADYKSASARLRQLGVPSVVAGLREIELDPGVHAFDNAVESATRGEFVSQGSAADQIVAPAIFRGYLGRTALVDRLVVTAAAATRTGAQHLASSERRAFIAWASAAAALAAASLAVAIVFARSIAKPLRNLADYAHAVNEGRLDADPPTGAHRGPRETRVAVAVFTDLVDNLRLLDAKANALATCSFDDPVLQQSLPGRLGRSLESSVAVLSGSIVERDRLQTHLAHQATHDALTGIANRAAAIVGIQEAIHRVARTGEAMALLFMDLNDFKAVNDRHGHEVGDAVLRQIASRLGVCVRTGDLVARLGGDEFVIVAEMIHGVDDAMDLAHRVVDAVVQPIDIGNISVTVGVAIGVAMTLDGPEEPLRLLARADAAMYRAKYQERSAIEIFDAALQQHMIEREDVEGALALALADPAGGGLLLHYQPVIETGSGKLVSLEALVRWNRPGHGLLPPDAFIPIAEATALIIDLDRWVLAEVGRRLISWSDDAELGHVPIAVNISGRHLQSGLLARHLTAMLEETGLDPHRLTIEITETVLLDDLVDAAAELDAVRALGIRVAIDDFGTGYTSLAHLQHLPIDMIKIDRSFISQLNMRRGSSLVRMVTDLGHAIDLGIIAEGVETEEELSALQAIGADQLQGYLMSKPLDASALKKWVGQRALVL